MRWDQWVRALLFNGLQGAVLGAGAFFLDGEVTRTEAMMIAGAFIGGMAMYMKDHPPSQITWAALVQQQAKVAERQDAVAVEKAVLAEMKDTKAESEKP